MTKTADSKLSCPVSRMCGGCQWMGESYEKQLQKKQQRVQELLKGICPKVNPIVGMETAPCHYRNKVHAAFALDSKHKIISGIYQPGSHAIVPVDECMIEDKTADAIIVDIRNMLKSFKIQVFDERNGTGWLRHVLVKRGFSTNEVMVVLVAVNPIFKLQKPFVKKLLEMHPEIKTIVLNINDRFGPVVLGTKEKVIYGEGYIEDILLGHRFRISPRSFYQVNPLQTEKLYSVAMDYAALTGNETVLDAYCGIGTIGITASSKAKQVIGVEINKDAVKDAISNARLNKLKNCWFAVGDAGEYMEQMARDKMRPDVVFMDPPRAGSDEKFIKSLIKCNPKRVVYISCNIETQKRDLQMLIKGGYIVKKIQPVDMFPFTNHVESVALLEKGK
jgi:23S rRNA (uracil1939-C5)-methyltransferase